MSEFCKVFETAYGQALVIKLENELRFMCSYGDDIFTTTEEFDTPEAAEEFFINLNDEDVCMEIIDGDRSGLDLH